ncbi:siderophore-interacting protein [Microbulbifer sp. ALW1]|uniref:siderophore-interacting protein n=1 Tax=Microbulbifer sp. (strain ALW1) TaxID=1516059 RepID=UPI00135BB489|nr:siderophore-interacting protein [Microbulbifer sp. ALW1]
MSRPGPKPNPNPKPKSRELEVITSRRISPHMLRVTLGGPELQDFPKDQESAYVKLLFEQGEGKKPLMRTYTIRHQRENEIDIDFVIHEHPGPAGAWAQQAEPGQRIHVAGPGARKLINPDGDWLLFLGDMTALPAISVNLSLLPEDARGHAVIEIASESDRQELQAPSNLEIHWVVNRDARAPGVALQQQLRQISWLEGNPAIWCATEFSTMREMRQYFRSERPVAASHRYISSYWKSGLSEEQHKVLKREDEVISGAFMAS